MHAVLSQVAWCSIWCCIVFYLKLHDLLSNVSWCSISCGMMLCHMRHDALSRVAWCSISCWMMFYLMLHDALSNVVWCSISCCVRDVLSQVHYILSSVWWCSIPCDMMLYLVLHEVLTRVEWCSFSWVSLFPWVADMQGGCLACWSCKIDSWLSWSCTEFCYARGAQEVLPRPSTAPGLVLPGILPTCGWFLWMIHS